MKKLSSNVENPKIIMSNPVISYVTYLNVGSDV